MSSDQAIMITAIPSTIGFIGLVIVAVFTRRTKSMELVYTKKADAYAKYLEQASVLVHASDTNGCHPDYLRALAAVKR